MPVRESRSRWPGTAAGLFGMTGAGLGALLGSEIATIAWPMYLYVAEPAVSHIAAFRSWTGTCPGWPPTA